MTLDEWTRAVRAGRPLRLRHRLRRVLLRDLPRRRAAARRAGGGAQARTRRLPATWSRSPACPSARTCPGMRSGFVAGDAALLEAVPALSHLSRLRDEPGRAARQHRRLERRGARARATARCTARSSRASCRCSSSAARRRRCPTPASTSGCARRSTTPSSPAAATPIQCDGAARQLSRARRRDGVNPGAGRVRIALVRRVEECVEAAQRIDRSFASRSALTERCKKSSTPPWNTAPHSAPATRPRELRDAVEEVIADLDAGTAARRREGRRRVGHAPVAQEGGAAVFRLNDNRVMRRRRHPLLRQGADQVRAPTTPTVARQPASASCRRRSRAAAPTSPRTSC